MSADRLPTSHPRGTWRVALRIARRTAARRKGRSALIVALIALPIAGVVAGLTVIASTVPSTAERLDFVLGDTQAKISIVSPPDPHLEQSPTEEGWYSTRLGEDGMPTGVREGAEPRAIEDLLPGGTRVLTLTESSATVRTATGLGGLTVLEGDGGSPELEGRTRLVEGRAPGNDSEVALNAAAMERLGLTIGESVRVIEPRISELAVVGVIEDERRAASESVMFVRPGVVTGPEAAFPLATNYYLPDLELDWDAVLDLNREGAVVYSRSVVLDPPSADAYTLGQGRSWTDSVPSYVQVVGLGGAFAMFQVCLLAGAAFLVGARADQRALAIVASVGGDRRALFRTVTASGITLGAIGGILGAGLGILAAYPLFLWLDDGSAQSYPGFHVEPISTAGVVIAAVLCGWLASLVAARAAARVDVVAALRGSRRPVAPSRRGRTIGVVLAVAGILLLAAGGVLALLATRRDGSHTMTDPLQLLVSVMALAAGGILTQLGVAVLSPSLLRSVARVLARWGAGPRIAARDLSRNHGRSVPTIAAIMSTVFLAAVIMSFVSSAQSFGDRTYPYGMPPGTLAVQLRLTDRDGAPADDDDRAADVERVIRGSIAGSEPTTFLAVPAPSGWEGVPDAEWTIVRVPEAADCAPAFATEGAELGCTLPIEAQTLGAVQIWVLDVAQIELLLESPLPAQARSILANGGAIVFDEAYVGADGTVALETWPSSAFRSGEIIGQTPMDRRQLRAIAVAPEHAMGLGIAVSPATADELGFDHGPARVVALVDAQPDTTEVDALNAGLRSLGSADQGLSDLWAQYEGGPQQFGGLFAWIAIAIAGVITFAASGVAIGLARADARRDAEVLDAVGASPGLRRSIAFWQAAVAAGLASVLGAAIGLLPNLALVAPGWVMVGLSGGTLIAPNADFAPPWLQLGVLVIVLPLVVAAGSWLSASRRRVAVRRMV